MAGVGWLLDPGYSPSGLWTPENVDALVASKQITPEMGASIKANLPQALGAMNPSIPTSALLPSQPGWEAPAPIEIHGAGAPTVSVDEGQAIPGPQAKAALAGPAAMMPTKPVPPSGPPMAAAKPASTSTGSVYGDYTHPEKQALNAEFLEPFEAMKQGHMLSAMSQANLAEKQAAALNSLAMKQEAIAKEHAEREAERQEFAKSKLDAYEQQYQALSKEKIDPDHFWADKNAFQMFAAAIAGIFGVLGAPATGGVNAGVAQIDRAIARDIEAQKATLESKHMALQGQKGIFLDYLRVMGDERMAEQATAAAMYENAKLKIDAMTQHAVGDAAIAAGTEAVAVLDQKAAMAKSGMWDTAYALKTAEEQAKIKAQQAYYAGLAAAEKKDMEHKWEFAKLQGHEIAKNGGPVTYPQWDPNSKQVLLWYQDPADGQHKVLTKVPDDVSRVAIAPVIIGKNANGEVITADGVATSKEAATKYSEAANKLSVLNKQLVELKALYDKYPHGTTGMFSEQEKLDKDRANFLATSILTIVKGPELANVGASFSANEEKMVKAIAPEDPLEPRAWSAIKAGAKGAALGAVAAPWAGIGAPIVGAYKTGSTAFNVNEKAVAFDMLGKTVEDKLDAYAATHFKVLPPKMDGSIPGKPLPLIKPVKTP